MKVVGLTGGIGAGKSAAARILSELGATVIDADRVGHDSYLPGTRGWQQVVAEFGHDVVAADGTIDRKRLATIVFADPARLARLNQIVHPLIRLAISARISAERDSGQQRPIVVEAALLIEAGWTALVDEVWVITAPRRLILERIESAQGLSPEAIAARIRAQLAEPERLTHADVVIENTGSLADLSSRLIRLWQQRRLER